MFFLRLIKQYLPYISIPYPNKVYSLAFSCFAKVPSFFQSCSIQQILFMRKLCAVEPKSIDFNRVLHFGNCERASEFREDWVWFSALAVDCFNLNSFRIQELNWNLMRGEGRATLKSKFNQNQGKIPNWMWLENIHSF